MESILDDLFMGKIDIIQNLPFRKLDLSPDKDEDETAFISTLTAEQRQIYEKIQNAFMDRCALEYKDCFITGFKMAVRLILESLSETDNPLI